MMANNRDEIERVRSHSDIVALISDYTQLKKLGKEYVGRCPFPNHEDSHPSFSVNEEKQVFYCHGCQEGGDVFYFVELHERVGCMDAVRIVAGRFGVNVLSFSDEERVVFEKKRLVSDVLTVTACFYSERLSEFPDVKDYLAGRGLTENYIQEKKIGYAPAEDSGLMKKLEEQGYSTDHAVDACVVYENGKEYYSGCITFPNLHRGKVIYITGRGYPEKSHRKPEKEKVPLEHLFLEENILRKKEVIITEGETDTYTLDQAGFNACGILGTGGFKEEWAGKFKNVDTIYVSLDGDEGGKNAGLKLGELFKEKARIVPFPDFTPPDGKKVKDWNDLYTKKCERDIQSFRQDYQKLRNQAQTVLENRIRQIPVKDIPKREISRNLSPIITEMTSMSGVEQEFYIDVIQDHFKGTLKISKQAIRGDIYQAQREIQEAQKELQQSGEEILGDDYFRVSPALDFIDGVGFVSVPLDVKLTIISRSLPVTRILQAPYLITSKKEFFRIDETALLEEKKIILKSHPTFLDSNRWSLEYMRQFREEGFKVQPFLVFQEVKTIYEEYIDFKEPHTAEVLSIWTIGTYIYPIFESYPYILFTGERGSGKTKSLTLGEKLCFNAVFSGSISTSMLFRIIEGSSCTLLIDEAERLKNPKLSQEFRSLLNSGYKRGSRAHRSKPDTFEPQSFEVYSPKMIANIKGLEEVLESRCIPFVMLRTNDIEKANKVVTEKSEDWPYIRNLLYCFGLTFFKEIQQIYLTDTETKKIRAISGREGELWHPVLAIARFLDKNGCDGLFEKIKEIAVKKGQAARSIGLDQWTNAMLLALETITINNETDIYTKDIRNKMKDYLEGDDQVPSSRWIGAKLKKLDLVEDSDKTNKGYRYSIKHETVEDVMERYGV